MYWQFQVYCGFRRKEEKVVKLVRKKNETGEKNIFTWGKIFWQKPKSLIARKSKENGKDVYTDKSSSKEITKKRKVFLPSYIFFQKYVFCMAQFNFSKMIWEFFMKTTAKVNLNVGCHGWVRKKISHSILLKRTFSSIFKQRKQKKMTECEKRLKVIPSTYKCSKF